MRPGPVPEGQADADALEGLAQTLGWAVMKRSLEANIANLEDQIISRSDAVGNALTEEQVDRQRDKRLNLLDLKDLPTKLADFLRKGEQAVPEQFDPYDRGGAG